MKVCVGVSVGVCVCVWVWLAADSWRVASTLHHSEIAKACVFVFKLPVWIAVAQGVECQVCVCVCVCVLCIKRVLALRLCRQVLRCITADTEEQFLPVCAGLTAADFL